MTASGPTIITIPYRPRVFQQQVHDAMKGRRFGVLVCHRRFGKTVLSVNHLIRGAVTCRKERPRWGYIAPTYTQGKATSFDYFKHYAAAVPGVAINQSELRCDFPNGGQTRIYGGDNADSLRGLYFDGVVLDEYGLHGAKTFSEVIAPTLVDRGGSALFLGTPNGKNQFYDIAQHAQDEQAAGNPDWFYLQFKASETGLLDEGYLKAARSVMTADEYQQEFECFPAGTLIATTRGQVPIELVRVGDTVLTHRNRWRPVTRTSQRVADEFVEVTAFGHQHPIRCTPEHPFLVYTKSGQKRSWKKAGELAAGDYLITPKLSGGSPVISEDWAALIAWFICEGSVSGNRVSFSLNPKNKQEVESVHVLLARLGFEPTWFSGSLGVNSVTLCDRLVAWCGSGAGSKRVPFDIIAGHESLVFDTLMLGDGCLVESVQGGRRHAFTTISHGLALDVQLLAASLGRRAGIVVRPAKPGVILGRHVHQRTSYLVQIPFGLKVNHGTVRQAHPCKFGIAYQVRSVSRLASTEPVFNLSVKEDESYVAMGRAVHNCSFEASVKGAIYAKELEQARADGRVTRIPIDPTIPVDTDWDLGIGDSMAVWFSQSLRTGEVRLIDYYEASGEGLPHYVKVLADKGYVYGSHWAPHDIRVRELGSGKSRLDVAASLGLKFKVTPRITGPVGVEVEEGIAAARLLMGRCWFDADRTKPGIEALTHYRRDYNERLNEFKPTPVHDWSSHAADAFRGLAVRHKLPALPVVAVPVYRPVSAWG